MDKVKTVRHLQPGTRCITEANIWHYLNGDERAAAESHAVLLFFCQKTYKCAASLGLSVPSA